MTLFGIDVSRYQGTLDWPRVRAGGISYVIAKASLGLEVDPEYAGKIAGAKAAGLTPGAYHYLWPGVDTAKSVDLFLRTVGTTDGQLLALDVEHMGVYREEYNAAVKEKDAAAIKAIRGKVYVAVRAWVTMFHQRRPEHQLLIYTGKWFWSGRLGNPKGVDLGPLWDSHYVTPIDPPEPYRAVYARVPAAWWLPAYGGWPKATMLQYTSAGEVAGYSGRLDCDAFRGSAADLDALTTDLPDTSEDSMRVFSIPEVPSICTVPKGTVLYASSTLGADPANVTLALETDLVYVGHAGEVAIVGYDRSPTIPGRSALYCKASAVTNIRPAPAAPRDYGVTVGGKVVGRVSLP